MKPINNQVHLTDADLKYLVDNIDIDNEGYGVAVLKEGCCELTVTAWFESCGGENLVTAFMGGWLREYEHLYWHSPKDIEIEFYGSDDKYDYELAQGMENRIEKAIEDLVVY